MNDFNDQRESARENAKEQVDPFYKRIADDVLRDLAKKHKYIVFDGLNGISCYDSDEKHLNGAITEILSVAALEETARYLKSWFDSTSLLPAEIRKQAKAAIQKKYYTRKQSIKSKP